MSPASLDPRFSQNMRTIGEMHGDKSRISTSRRESSLLVCHLRSNSPFCHLLTLTQAKLVQSGRSAGTGSSIGRAPSVMTTSSVSSGTTSRGMPPSSYIKKAPPPPPSQPSAPPPPYTFSAPTNNATNNGVSAAATKRPPPPPPPLKPKPKPAPEYVTALYDFDAQVCLMYRDCLNPLIIYVQGGRRFVIQDW